MPSLVAVLAPRGNAASPAPYRSVLRRLPCLVLLLWCGCSTARGSDAGEDALRVLLDERFTDGRLAGQAAWQPCAPRDTAALVPRGACGALPRAGTRAHARITRATAAVLRPAGDSLPPRLRALAELRWHAAAPAGLDRAAALLERARAGSPGDAAVLNDLAVTYLQRAHGEQELLPLLQALDAVESALEQDSTRTESLFNRALVLQRLYLLESARRAWQRYLEVERDPRWRAEAEAHAGRLALRADTTPVQALLDSAVSGTPAHAAALDARVRRSPQEARELGLRSLAEWGAAVAAGDSTAAGRSLARAAQAAAVAERLGGDQTLPLALRHLRGRGADARALAVAYVRYDAGVAAWRARANERAAGILREAEAALRGLGSPVAPWAAYWWAGAEMGMGHFEPADTLFARALRGAAPAQPGLAGRALWGLGVTRVRRGHFDQANGYYRQAVPLIARAREPDNLGTLSYLLAEGLTLAGQSVAGRAETLRGLKLLSPYRRSLHLSNHLGTAVAYARAGGLRHAALAVRGEAVEVARGLRQADALALALCARAEELGGMGRTAAARADLAQARRWTDSLPAGKARDRLRADVDLARARLTLRDDPRAAYTLLLEVVRAYRRVNIEIHLPVALYEAARAARRLDDPAAARGHLREAIAWIERRQETFASPEVRATHAETVEDVFDDMIALELDGGRPASAFAYLERSRAAAWPSSSRLAPAAPPTLAAVGERLPRGMRLVEYALLEDRTVVWTASRDGWAQHTVRVPRDTVAALVRRFGEEMDRADAGPQGARARLYDLLVRPLAAELDGDTLLVVVPDRELNQVPFAALWSRETGRYLLQDHEVRTVPSAAFFAAARARGRGPAGGGSALVMGDPALDARAAQQLPPLPGAAREAERVAGLYPRRHLLMGPAARRDSLVAQLPAHPVFHFAGHAVFNTELPELSYLVLAPGGGSEGTLHAWEIGRMRLSNLHVVILSACSTLGPRPSRAGPTAGLAYSFLRAGAPATVSTLWDVSDAPTTELLVEFHRRYAAGAPAPAALRAAQLRALASAQPAMRAPRGWAAFIYTGP